MLFSLVGCTAAKGAFSISSAEFVEYLNKQVPRLMDDYDIPGAGVALLEGGEVTWVQGFGYADREEEKPVTSSTLFRAESITKSLTAWAVMNLVEEEEIGLDDPVENYLSRWEFPDTEFPKSEVTVRQLLSHSSGLTGGSDRELPGKERPPLTQVLEGEYDLYRARLVREPGTEFEYSNQGFMVLELLVEEVTGRDYEEYLQEEILLPLEVEEAYFDVDEISSRLAVSYDYRGDPLPVYQDLFRGAGGLLINAEGLARFWASGMPGQDGLEPGRGILRPDSVAQLHTPVMEPAGFYRIGADGSGLGHFIDQLPGGEKAVFHGGEGAGSLGKAYVVPEDSRGLVILTNSKRSWPLLFKLTGDWAEWNGYASPAMSNVYFNVETAIWSLIILLVLASLGKLALLIRGLVRGRRGFAPFSSRKRFSRLMQMALALLGVFLWWLAGEMIVANLLPVIYGRLGLALGFLAFTVLLAGLFPPVDE